MLCKVYPIAAQKSSTQQQSPNNGSGYQTQPSHPSPSPDTGLHRRTASWILQLQQQETQRLQQVPSGFQEPLQGVKVSARQSLPSQQQVPARQEQNRRYQRQSFIEPQPQQQSVIPRQLFLPKAGWNLQESHLQEPLASTRHHSSLAGLYGQQKLYTFDNTAGLPAVEDQDVTQSQRPAQQHCGQEIPDPQQQLQQQQLPTQYETAAPDQNMRAAQPQRQLQSQEQHIPAGTATSDDKAQRAGRLSSPSLSSHAVKISHLLDQEQALSSGSPENISQVRLNQQHSFPWQLKQPSQQIQQQGQEQRQRQSDQTYYPYQPYRPNQYQPNLQQADDPRQPRQQQQQRGAALKHHETPHPHHHSSARANTFGNGGSSEGSSNRRTSALLSGIIGKMRGKDKEKKDNSVAATATPVSEPQYASSSISGAVKEPSYSSGWPQHSQTGPVQSHSMPSQQQKYQLGIPLNGPTAPVRDAFVGNSAWARAATKTTSLPQQQQQQQSFQPLNSQSAPILTNVPINTRPSPSNDGTSRDGLADFDTASMLPSTVSPDGKVNSYGKPLLGKTSTIQTATPQSGPVSDASTGVASSTPDTVSPLERMSIEAASPRLVGMTSASRGHLYPNLSSPIPGKVTRKPVPSRTLPLQRSSKPAPPVQPASEPLTDGTTTAPAYSHQHQINPSLQRLPGIAHTKERPSSTVSSLTVNGAADTGTKQTSGTVSTSVGHPHGSSPTVSAVSDPSIAGSSGAIVLPTPPLKGEHKRVSTLPFLGQDGFIPEQREFHSDSYHQQPNQTPANDVKAAKVLDQRRRLAKSGHEEPVTQDHTSRTENEKPRAKNFFGRFLKRSSRGGDYAFSLGATDPEGPPPGGPQYPPGQAPPSPRRKLASHDENNLNGRQLDEPMRFSLQMERPTQLAYAHTDQHNTPWQQQPDDGNGPWQKPAANSYPPPVRMHQQQRVSQFPRQLLPSSNSTLSNVNNVAVAPSNSRMQALQRQVSPIEVQQQQLDQFPQSQKVQQWKAADNQPQTFSQQSQGPLRRQDQTHPNAAGQADVISPLNQTRRPMQDFQAPSLISPTSASQSAGAAYHQQHPLMSSAPFSPPASLSSPLGEDSVVADAVPAHLYPTPQIPPFVQQQLQQEMNRGGTKPTAAALSEKSFSAARCATSEASASSMHASPQPGQAQLSKDSAVSQQNTFSHASSHENSPAIEDPGSKLTLAPSEASPAAANVHMVSLSAGVPIERELRQKQTLARGIKPTSAAVPVPDEMEETPTHHAKASTSNTIADVSPVSLISEPISQVAPENSLEDSAAVTMPTAHKDSPVALDFAVISSTAGATSPIAQLGPMEPNIDDITPPSPIDDSDFTEYGFPVGGKLSATGGLPLPYVSNGGPLGESQAKGNVLSENSTVTRQKTIRQTPAQEYEDYKRRQMLKDLEEKIPVLIPEPDQNLAAQKQKENEEPAMSATSYPGQEWNPYGEFYYEDDD